MRFSILSKLLLYSSLRAHFVCCSWILDRLIAGNLLSALPLWYLFLPWIVRSVIGSYAFLGLTGLGVSAPLILFAGLRWVVEKFVGRKIRPPFRTYCSPLLETTLWVCAIICLVAWCWVCGFYATWRLSTKFMLLDITKASVLQTLTRGSLNLLLYMGVLWGIKHFLASFDERSFGRSKSLLNSHGVLVVFASWNFIQTLLYYCIRYDSQGTIKPPWTDNLG
jgi:hypothetical protein